MAGLQGQTPAKNGPIPANAKKVPARERSPRTAQGCGGRIFGCSLSPVPSLPSSPAALLLRAAGGNGKLRRKESIRFPPLRVFSGLPDTLASHAPAQDQWPGSVKGAGAEEDDFLQHRQGNPRCQCPRGPPSAVRGLLPAVASPPLPPTPCLPRPERQPC